MEILRDIFRRKARSILTVTGVAIGVFALVVLGSASENNRVYIDRVTSYYDGVITVIDDQDTSIMGLGAGERPLSMDLKPQLDAYPGVKNAFPLVTSLIDEDYFSVIPPVVISVSPGMWTDYLDATAAQGRLIEGTTRGEVVLGSDLAVGSKLNVGDVMTIHDMRFTVAGILDRTFVNVSDSAAYVPLADAQQLFWLNLPKAFQDSVKPEDLAVQYSVAIEDGVDGDALAAKLERDFDNVTATGPTAMMEAATGLVDLLTAIVFGVSAIALIVCTLSVVNTMTMSVGERTREIGLKRALGASRGRVARDVLVESALMSLIGGLVGIALGVIVVAGVNSAIVAATGTSSLLVTWRLVFIALALSVVLGLIGGLWPARYASRLDPAAALAYE
ncbi:MAG: FtsX-like permease family protein [Coriobacteriia bacterium]|nr:FtsX-like permease family protein [Coriobacteriia bacterium]